MTGRTEVSRTIGPGLAVILGAMPLLAWWAMDALGWAPDAQVLSGTLDPSSPAAGALRGLWIAGARLLAWVVSPPLVAGGLLWWGIRRARRS